MIGASNYTTPFDRGSFLSQARRAIQADLRSCSERMGKLRRRFPVAAKIALVIASTIGGTGGSPTPNSCVLSLVTRRVIIHFDRAPGPVDGKADLRHRNVWIISAPIRSTFLREQQIMAYVIQPLL